MSFPVNSKETDYDGSQNQALPLTIQRPQLHEFISINAAASNANSSFYLTPNFPVKEMKISVAYNIESASLDVYYLTTNMPGLQSGNVIASMSNISYVSAVPAYYYTSDLGRGGEVSYLFREPTLLNGSWNCNILSVGGSVVITADLLVHFEFLG